MLAHGHVEFCAFCRAIEAIDFTDPMARLRAMDAVFDAGERVTRLHVAYRARRRMRRFR